MKIYDCFTFRNELDLLEIRLEEIADYIDHFVIVEATHTFQGRHKPLVLLENWDRFKKWHPKIIHVVVDDLPNRGNAWENEHHQRNAILKGICHAAEDDIIIISDVDELLRAEIVIDMRKNPRECYGFRIPYFNFKFNYMLVDDPESYCVWNTAGRKRFISNPEQFRSRRFTFNKLMYEHDDGITKIYEHAGWHFTYLGNTEWIIEKLQSFAHVELNSNDILKSIDVDQMIDNNVGFNPTDSRPFVKVALDDYFPKTILENREKYIDLILIGELDSINRYI
jgi:hypothetical protein